MTRYQLHVRRWSSCTACELSQVRRRVVLARGSVPCDVLFVGEAPGKSEDVLGSPFVGPAGHLLDDVIADALDGFVVQPDSPFEAERPARVAFTNLVACLPKDGAGGKLEPTKDQVRACRPRLDEFALLCEPRWVVKVGVLSRKHLPEPAWGAPTCSIDHPAFAVRQPPAIRAGVARKMAVTVRQFLEQ